ncbi:putative transmembrane family 234 [Arabidopsis thaliana x Arabidopsis arenosa]|uniref:Putative transmembrane family 234 n=1 Tax=Arabidopsis thaliana x Arabidopsis arenosa TaxID=1240361 RepID=A0A8T1YXI2_9BRAS|nr:putative transmembrane family 234 [Arabidopsis thaliana x Arabidopsis arenosa]
MKEDMEKMVAVGLVWGATNALIRRGALAWDNRKSSLTTESPPPPLQIRRKIMIALRDWINLLLFWQYSIPFLINLSASATFFALLSHAPISLAVPVTNATTFSATAAFGILLGEETQIGLALLGTSFIVFGIWLCVL